ncbi:hypothetical protein BJX99DRAFT_259383 [Aspergillus californicus]
MPLSIKYFILATAALTAASPQEPSTDPVVNIYKDIFYGPPSQSVPVTGQCVTLPDNFRHDFDSIRISLNVVCDLFNDDDCSDAVYLGMLFPGSPNLIAQGLDQRVASLICYH